MRRYLRSPKGFSALFRRHFLTGIFVLIPFGVVAWILYKFCAALWSLHLLIPDEWKPNYYLEPFAAGFLNFAITIGIAILFAFFVSSLGWFSKNILGARVLRFISKLIQRIPVVRAIYSSLNQLFKTMASGGKQQFSRVVYIEYPRKGTYVLAFVTSTARAPIEHSNDHYLNLYVPTTPNPTSGFHLIVSESEVRDSNLSVEEAFKTILSLGIAQTEETGSYGKN